MLLESNRHNYGLEFNNEKKGNSNTEKTPSILPKWEEMGQQLSIKKNEQLMSLFKHFNKIFKSHYVFRI